jgi:uncharacterized protein YbaP (TraB family)
MAAVLAIEAQLGQASEAIRPAMYSEADWIIVDSIRSMASGSSMIRHWHRLFQSRTSPHRPGTPAVLAGVCLLVGLLLQLAAAAGPAADCRPVAAEPPVAAKAQDFNRGLLWKIETAGGAPSYLFGSFHSSDPRITLLPCPVKEAFDHATSYTMEVIANGAGIVSMAEAMYFSDGQTLRNVLGEALYLDTQRAARAHDALLATGIDHMKPWAVMVALSSPRAGRGLFLDMALQAQATLRDIPTYGLETMQEQIEVFNGMSLDDQVALLRDTVQSTERTQAAMGELTAAYLKRDLAALLALSEKYKPRDARVYDAMMDRLLKQRNAHMAERMRVRLKEGNAFIAVGALHLPGDAGLLRLLSTAGYRVTRVY